MTRWTARDIPDLTGRHALVTGASSGLGFHTVLELARHGATVVATARDEQKGADTVRRVRQQVPAARVTSVVLDLADLASVRSVATSYDGPLDVLVNNAGVMAVPARRTVDGFELQLGTNHLGHFALTAGLLPALLERPGARVVTVSSVAHRMGTIRFDDLMGDSGYQPWAAYGQSKLANLLFMRELDRRARLAGLGLVSVAAHPGYAATNLQARGPQMAGSRVGVALMRVGNVVLGQRASQGALPQLFAATAPGVVGGAYVGPRGPGEWRGAPRLVGLSRAARDDAAAAELWRRSEELTGASWPALEVAV